MAEGSAERRQRVTRGTGNVFADLGFRETVGRQAKLHLAYALNQVLDERELSQADAANVLGLTQPKVSALRHYKVGGLFHRTLDEPVDGARSGCRDRDSSKAALKEISKNQRRRRTDGGHTKGHDAKASPVLDRQTPSGRSAPQGA